MAGFNIHLPDAVAPAIEKQLRDEFAIEHHDDHPAYKAFNEAAPMAHDLCRYVYADAEKFNISISGNAHDPDEVDDNVPEFISIIVTKVDPDNPITVSGEATKVKVPA